jgi:DNA (cytosine-5)-methyltransferase 1
MTKPRLLDLFCGAGGAAMGYHRAGFEVVGVDIKPQPHYPFEFVRADAVDWLYENGAPSIRLSFDAIHASPPCQRYSDLAKRNGNGDDWPDLVAPVRALLDVTGLPWVIENVEGAPLSPDLILCGTMFPGLRVLRHRVFEFSDPRIGEALRLPHAMHPLVYTRDKRKAHYGKLDPHVAFVSVNGGGNAPVVEKRAAMGVDWPMTGHEVNEAIPPAYTEFIGRQLLAALEVAA